MARGQDAAPHPSRPASDASASWSRALVKEIAMDCGKEICAYVEVMFPDAIEATRNTTFLLSLRNSVHNQIMAALDGPNDEVSIRARLAERKAWRRKWKADWKKIRAMPDLGAEGVDEAGEQVLASSPATPSDPIRDALVEALRGWAIKRFDGGSGPMVACNQCGGEWHPVDGEHHEPDCLAALDEGCALAKDGER